MSGSDPAGTANTAGTTGNVWKPRLQVYLGAQGVHAPATPADQLVTTALTAMVQKSNWYQPDKHKCTFALFGDPQFDYAFWVGFDTMSIMVKISFDDGASFTEVFRGFVDKVVIDCMKGIVTVEGRNCLGLLVDTTLVEFYTNNTVGDVLTQIFNAKNLPLDISAIGDVAGLDTGRYWPSDDSKTVDGLAHHSMLNPYELVTELCRQFGITSYEDAGTTFFIPNPTGNQDYQFVVNAPMVTSTTSGNGSGVTVLSASNATSLVITHDLNISQWGWYARGVNYDDSGVAKGNTQTWPEQIPDNPQVIELTSANKIDDDNKRFTQSIYQEFVLQEWTVTYKVAGPQIINMKLNNYFALLQLDDKINGWFAIDSIEHQISFDKGYVGTVKGRWGRANGENS